MTDFRINEDYQVATVKGRAVTKAQLRTAFDLVADKANWKMPIDATVQYGDLDGDRIAMIREAVIFFTGSVPTFTQLRYGWMRVRAAGYYNTIGA